MKFKRERGNEMRRCPNCGGVESNDANYCGRCGAKISEKDCLQESESNISEQQKVVSKSKIVGIILMIICAVFLIGNFIASDEKEKDFLVEADKFEEQMNNEIINFYGEHGIDAKVEGYLIKNYETIELTDNIKKNANYEKMILCQYGPGSAVILNAYTNNGKIVRIDTILPFGRGIVSATDVANAIPVLMVPVSLINDEYVGYEKLRELSKKILEIQKDNKYATLEMGGITYQIILSEFMVTFKIKVKEENAVTAKTSNIANDSNVDDIKKESVSTTKPLEKTGYEYYDKKINEYASAATMNSEEFFRKYDGGNDCRSINALILGNYHRFGGKSVAYSIYDIDKNGIPELIFSDMKNIIDIYTLKGNRLVKLYEDCYFGDRSRLHILSDGRLLTEGSSGAGSGSCELARISENDAKIEVIKSYYYDESDFVEKTHEYISKDEFYQLINDLLQKTVFKEMRWSIITSN